MANTTAIHDFLNKEPITPTDEDVDDIIRRKELDERRIDEQKKFYEIARKRAAELDEYMEQYVLLVPLLAMEPSEANILQIPQRHSGEQWLDDALPRDQRKKDDR